jgi:hypothetical protein
MDPHEARKVLNTSSGWFKSSYSGGQNGCVEMNFAAPGYAGMRDSKLGDASPVLVFTAPELKAFLLGVKAGEFDDPVS